MTQLSFGETLVCKWKGNRRAAYSVGGDDSLRSQLFFAIPEMEKRGIHGTWWVNPGRGGSENFKNRDDEWAECWIACYDRWVAAAARGHDFGNHTLHHLGAASYAEAEHEIGRTAEIIWQANPRQRLQLFLSGGGTTWGVPGEQVDEILQKYDCVRGRGGGVEDPTWEIDPSPELLKSYVDRAIDEQSWRLVGFHGIGPDCEWGGPVSAEAFTALLDHLAHRSADIWAGTHTEVHKYDQERASAAVNVIQASPGAIRLELTARTDPRLYDDPLTLRTGVAPGWERVRVSQGAEAAQAAVTGGVAQYQARPNRGEIKIERA